FAAMHFVLLMFRCRTFMNISVSLSLHRTLYAIRLLGIAAAILTSEAESSDSLHLCFVRTHDYLFNGFTRRSEVTCLSTEPSYVLVLISLRRYANCARWKKFYKNGALSA